MPAKISTHVFKGMQKDINVANSSNEYLFDAHNIRFNLLDDNTLMSIVNEKGNEEINFIAGNAYTNGIIGKYIGSYVVNNYIMVFTHTDERLTPGGVVIPAVDRIYRIFNVDVEPTLDLMFNGNLNFDLYHPLEFTSFFESENVIKIYWVDGKNQLRFMNILSDPEDYTDANQFNTTPELRLEEEITVEQLEGNGEFPAGVIQYAFTYVNKLGAESNIFFVTKLHSIQHKDVAIKPGETTNCQFRITIENVDTDFDYLRCYQLIRTSLDAEPKCIVLNDVSIDKLNVENNTIIIYDTNVGAAYDVNSLLFPKYPIIANTLDQKNNTLFLGNFNELVFEIKDEDIVSIREYFNSTATYTALEIADLSDPNYRPASADIPDVPILRFVNFREELYQLDNNNGYSINADADVIRTFKSRETYRIAVLLQDIHGIWSEPIYLKDITVDCVPLIQDDIVIPISLIFDVSKAPNFPNLVTERTFKKFRFLMVQPLPKDRRTIALGIVVPTIYEVTDRCNNAPFNYSSWFVRPLSSRVEFRHNAPIISGDYVLTQPEMKMAEILGGMNYINWYSETGESPTTNPILQVIISSEITLTPVNFADWSPADFDNYELMFDFLFYLRIELANQTSQLKLIYEPLLELKKKFLKIAAYPYTIGYASDLKAIGEMLYFTQAGYDKIINFVTTSFTNGGSLYTELLSQHSTLLTEFCNGLLGDTYVYEGLTYYDGCNALGPYYSTSIRVLKHTVYFGDGLTYFDLDDYILDITEQPRYEAGIGTYFKVDHSVLNLYSPDINNNYHTINKTNLNLNLIGYSTVQTLIDSANVELVNSGGNSNSYAYKNRNFVYNDLRTFDNVKPYFKDAVALKLEALEDDDQTYDGQSEEILFGGRLFNYAVYLWHSAGSLNNEDNTKGDNRSAKYNKIFARQWNCNNTVYFKNPYWYSNSGLHINESGCNTGSLFICNNTSSVKLFKLNNKYKTYIANPDLARTFVTGEGYNINIFYSNTPDILNSSSITKLSSLNKEMIGADGDKYDGYSIIEKGKDPVLIKYTSDTHVVIPIERTLSSYTVGSLQKDLLVLSRLPNLNSLQIDYNTPAIPTELEWLPYIPTNEYYPIWDRRVAYKDIDKTIPLEDHYDGEYFYIGELYRDIVNIYGGEITIDTDGLYDKSSTVVTSNIYIPITTSIPLSSLSQENNILSTTYGDTWFGRWDCLKTLETTDLDYQRVHDYASVMIESHINLNGRYDNYRNFYDLTLVNALNANKFNDVYNQMDNFWLYKILSNIMNVYNYPNQITWSLTKTSGSLVDEWTRTIAANIQEMDGIEGSVNKILNYNDRLLIFLDKCVSLLLYNEQMQMTTTSGLPVEISNSLKVTGYKKLFQGVGCVNKWSICNTANGVYFVDNKNSSIMFINDDQKQPIINLSNNNAFILFMKKQNCFEVWNPIDFNNFITFTDSLTDDTYFINKNLCLAYNITLPAFTSFYSYEGTFNMFNINDHFYSLYDKNGIKLYRNFTGKYNKIYGEFVDTSFTFIDHGESFLTDKTFTNINYIQDAYNVNNVDGLLTQGVRFTDDYDNTDYYYEKDVTFQKLRVWTPFLDTGDIILIPNEDLQRKFRTWGIQISRDLKYNNTSVDRIRNNWAKFKFTFTQPDLDKDIKIELMNINILSIE